MAILDSRKEESTRADMIRQISTLPALKEGEAQIMILMDCIAEHAKSGSPDSQSSDPAMPRQPLLPFSFD